MKLSRVVIKVRDYRKSFEFYKNTMGLKLSSSWQRKDSWGALFSTGSANIEIIWFPSGQGLDDCNFIPYNAKIEIELEVNDVNIWYQRLKSAGADLIDSPHDVPWGYHIFKVRDPDNIPIILSQPIASK